MLPDYNRDEIRKITIRTLDVPDKWHYANSFGSQKSKVDVHTSLNELKYALFIMGDFRLNEFSIGGESVVTAVRGQWSFGDEQFQKNIKTVLETQRNFWSAGKFPYFLVSLIPSGPDCCHYAGTSLTNAMSLFISEKATLNDSMAHMMAHESFHAWNGRLIKRAYPEELVFWFSEGFTNYYARKFNLASGLINRQSYVQGINDVLKDYYSSPARTAQNQRVLGEFWSNQKINQLPYLKGEILAMIWNDKLQKRTGKSLDDFMKSVLKRSLSASARISNQTINETMSQWLPEGVNQDIQSFVENGELFKDLPQKLDACIELQHSPSPQPSTNHWGSTASYTNATANQKSLHIPQYRIVEGC